MIVPDPCALCTISALDLAIAGCDDTSRGRYVPQFATHSASVLRGSHPVWISDG